MSENLCIYHKNCLDGFTAAWVVNKALNGDCEFITAKYGDAPPDVKDKNVYIVDFSYPRSILIEMAVPAKKIIILDHHKSAEEDLCSSPFPVSIQDKLQIIFDMTRSGAMLTWNYFFSNQAAPSGLECVQDRDLWQFNFGATKAFTAYLFSEPINFEVWDQLMNNANFTGIVESGQALLRKHDKDVLTFLELTETLLYIECPYFKNIPCCNVLPNLASDVGHHLLQRHTDAPFSATFYYKKGEWNFSLRSEDSREDVSKIAKQFGGGGHRNAAGFKIHTTPDSLFYFAIDAHGAVHLNLSSSIHH